MISVIVSNVSDSFYSASEATTFWKRGSWRLPPTKQYEGLRAIAFRQIGGKPTLTPATHIVGHAPCALRYLFKYNDREIARVWLGTITNIAIQCPRYYVVFSVTRAIRPAILPFLSDGAIPPFE